MFPVYYPRSRSRCLSPYPNVLAFFLEDVIDEGNNEFDTGMVDLIASSSIVAVFPTEFQEPNGMADLTTRKRYL